MFGKTHKRKSIMSSEFNPVGWFEIPVLDLPRAMAFYEQVLGLPLELHEMGAFQMAWFPMKEGAYGAMGSLVLGESYVPSHAGSLVYFSVQDIESVLARATEQGGKVLLPKTSIGEYGFIAHLEDSEGNRVAIHSSAG